LTARFSSRRRLALALAVALAAIPIAYAAQSANGSTEMRFACAKERGGALRYVARAGACTNAERLIRFRQDDAVIACARQGGNVYVVGKRRACRRAPHAPSLVLVLPDDERHSFCAHKRTGVLRSIEHVPYDPPRPRFGGSSCKSNEKRVFVKKENQPPNARDDAATVDEASAAGIDVLANDRDPEGRRLRIESVDAGAIRGAVAVAANRRSLSYNPNGQFEALGVGASATEAFTYRATDGRKRDRARVTVTVRGLNDGPSAAADAASTDENTATTLAVLSNDSDPDQGDSLSVTAVDTTGTAGAVTINPNGTLTYNPAGRLDDLRPGETRIARFGYTISDGHGGSASATASVNVSGLNDPPAVTTSAGDTAYTENVGSSAIDAGLTVSDADDASLGGATATIAGFEAGDLLDFTDQNGITGTYDSGTGVLTLTGTASVADYQAALRSIEYSTTNDDPATAKSVASAVTDGSADSAPATKGIAITPVNDAPTVTTSAGSAAFTEGSLPVAVDPTLVVGDPDSTMLTGATATLTSSVSDETLGFVGQSGITGAYDAGTGVLTLSGTATVAQYQAVLRSVTYFNSADNPSTATRTVTFAVTDAGGLTSAPDSRDVTVGPTNDPPEVTLSAGDTPYTENAAATPIDSGLTVTDPDDTHLEGATVAVVDNFDSDDELVFTDQNGITGDPIDDDTLTLTGTATVAQYQAALRSVRFEHTGDDPETSREVMFIARDGEDESPGLLAVRTITITPVNDAPTVFTSPGSAAFTEDGGPVAVDPGVSVFDPDSAMLTGATVALAPPAAPAEALGFTNQNGISGTYDAGTGVLTLSGTATSANYEAALRSVTYNNGSHNPSTATRFVSFAVTDAGGLTSAGASRGVTIAAVNDAPLVTTSAGDTPYTENDPATAVDTGLTVTDVDDTDLEGATVTITTGFQPGDELLFTNQAGITGSLAGDTLTLTGTATLAGYQTALRSVQFRHMGDNPATSKTVEFTADDGGVDSAPATKSITITSVNDAPTLDPTNAALAYPEGAGLVAADPGIIVIDPDSTQLQGATVQITSNFVSAQDELAFTNQLGITSSYDDTTGTLTLSGTASVASYQAALRAVTYENGSDDPSPPARTLTFLATDAEGATSLPATRDITLGAANDAATIMTSGAALSYTEGDPATAVDGNLTVTDADDTQLEGATVRISAGFEAGDELLFTNQSGITGTYNAAAGVLTLAGTASKASYQTALRSVAFRTTNDNPATTKTVEFRANDGDGLGPASTRNIDLTRVNDAPTVDTSGGSASFTEGGGPVAVDPGVVVSDPDSATLAGAVVSITGGFDADEDSLGFTDQNGIDGDYDAGSGVLTLNGSASVADYQTALRSVTYDNDSDAPSGTRTVSFQVSDGALESNVDTRDLTVAGTNDAPVVTTSAGSTAYTEGDPAIAVDGALTVADVDDTSLEGATVRIATGFDPGDDLVFLNQLGINGGYDGAGTLTLTGTSSLANYETALRSVVFAATDDSPTTSKTVEFTVNDGDADSAAATKVITVTPVNDGPTITTTIANLAYTENAGAVAIDNGLNLSDPDSTQISVATVTISTNFQPAQDELGFTDQAGITGAYNDTTGVLTLSGPASLADYQAALRTVTYTNVSEGPTPLSRTIAFQATDAEGPSSATSNLATRGIAITAVNDPPNAVNDTGTTDEDTTVNVAAPGVLANDTDVDPGDTKTVDRLNGSVTLTGTSVKGAAVTINANGSFSYNPGSIFQGLSTGQNDTDSFTYRLSDGGGASSTGTVNITIIGVSDAPVATSDSFDAIGNTALSVGTSRPTGEAGKVITGSVLTNDTDVDTPQANLVAETVTNAPTTLGGTITIESDGNFTYHPDDGDVGVTDTFTYRVCDATPCNAGTVANSTGTLNLPLAGQVWYVQNNEPVGGDGTSDTPFDTLAEAEAASGSGDTVYVFDGANNSTNLATGFVMEANERLIGEVAGVSLAGHPLHAGTTDAHPTLAASNEDVVVLASGATVDGVNVDPALAGGGIFGGAGTSNVTINDVNVTDGTGTPGTQPGLEFNGTGGTSNVSDLTVSTNGATGVLLNNAGTVNFTPASAIDITTNGARGLDATGTSMGAASSTFDSITVTGSANGGVSMTSTTGTTTFAGLSLTTTGGTGFLLNNAGTVSVPAAGTANVSATGGPAIDVTNTSGITLDFDNVSSTNSTGDGINLAGLGTGTFSATSGSIGGAAGIAFDLDGGSGTVTYPGDLNNGSGLTAEITARGGGAVTLSGPIADTNDAGGGISLSGNTGGGSTTFSNASKVLNTGTSNAVSFTSSDGHTLNLTNGGLIVVTTTGQGVLATTSGTINVAGSGNTVTSTTGRAVNVQSTDFGGTGGFTFQSVSSNGAPNGILLSNTGTSAGMTITGTGANNSGGTIQNSTEHGVSLTTTNSFNADELSITGANFAGVDGTDVTNFTYTDGEILNAGDSLTNPLHGSIALNDQAGNENNVDGTVVITGNLLKDHYGGGVDVFNRNGTIADATVSNNTIDSPADEALSKEDAISFNLFGSASTVASMTKAQIEDNVITDHPSGNGITILGAQTNVSPAPTPTIGVPGSATNRVLIDGNLLTGDPTLRFGGSAIQAGIEGRGVGNFDITNNGNVANPITNAGTHGIATGNSGSSEVEYLIQNNRVNANNFEGGGLGIRSASDQHIMVGGTTLATPILRTSIVNNHVRNTTGGGIRVLAGNSNGTAQVRVNNNDVANGGAGTSGIDIGNGGTTGAPFTATMCATISGNTVAANAPSLGGNTFPGILLAKRVGEFGVPGLTPSPAPNATTESFLTTLNPNSNLGGAFYAGKRVAVNVGDNFVSCTHPPGF
jgi:VCBS repeat-containing protein